MDYEVNERPTAFNKKKNTKKWCKGKPGREHDPVIRLDTRLLYGKRTGCYWWSWNSWRSGSEKVIKRRWQCYHHEVCSNCGKELRYTVDCPDKTKD